MTIRFLRRNDEWRPSRDGAAVTALTSSGLDVARARSALATAHRILVVTGAGLSVAAGLPTYRGAGGLYTGPEGVPSALHADALPDSLPELWAFQEQSRDRVRHAEPTLAHHALADWQRTRAAAGDQVTLVTANVDDLHERAGSEQVHHLHGSVFTTACLTPGCRGRVDDDTRPDPASHPCGTCGGPTRPGMVLFGEVVDLDAQWAARQMLRQCQAFLAIGTSGTVTPPYAWLRYARDVGAPSILVNPDPDPRVRDGYDLHVQLDADTAVPLLLDV